MVIAIALGSILLLGGLGLYGAALMRQPSHKKAYIFAGSCAGLLLLAAWAIFFLIPIHNSKQLILQCLQDKFQLSYGDLHIVARSPGEGELFDLSDQESGAVAFTSSRPLVFEGENDCLLDIGRLQTHLESYEPGQSLSGNTQGMKCQSYEKGNRFSRCTLFRKDSENIYFLLYQWSFG